MRYFHYSTWDGEYIKDSGIIHPSKDYLDKNQQFIPKLVFLTTNEHWEPCIQARANKIDYIKGPSCPQEYLEQGIPCWKFEVILVKPPYKLIYYHPDWMYMLKDGKDLGSDLSQWHWVRHKCKVINSFLWEDLNWSLQ